MLCLSLEVVNTTIKEFCPGDAVNYPHMARFLAVAYEVEESRWLLEDEYRHFENQRALLAFAGEQLVGSITYFPEPGRHRVWGVAVHPNARGQGVGAKLYQSVAEKVNFSDIVGSTRNPVAVKVRHKALSPLGYVTNLGDISYVNSPAIKESNISLTEVPQEFKAHFARLADAPKRSNEVAMLELVSRKKN